jgi:hypothetical protein
MDAEALEPNRRAAWRVWLGILLTAPVMTALCAYLVYQWQVQHRDFVEIKNYFVQRQNQVLAHESIRVAKLFSDVLGQAARDASLLAALPPRAELYEAFARALNGLNPEPGAITKVRYNRVWVLRNRKQLWDFAPDRKSTTAFTKVEDCENRTLCDRQTLEAAFRLPQGKAIVGRGMRWYTAQNSAPSGGDRQGTLMVAYRSADSVVALGVSFEVLLRLIHQPVFPFSPQGDMLEEYEKGSYIYLLDEHLNLLAHPKKGHMLGLDSVTFEPVSPALEDRDVGQHPLNFRAYREGKLRAYFDRLMSGPVQKGEVDVFEASNFTGMIRVVSVAPVLLDASLFVQKAPIGYVGVGCAVEHFAEPEQRPVPYY